MGIRINGSKVPAIYYTTIPVLAVYTNGQLVWPEDTLILSCYYNGYWIDDYPWTDDTPWTD